MHSVDHRNAHGYPEERDVQRHTWSWNAGPTHAHVAALSEIVYYEANRETIGDAGGIEAIAIPSGFGVPVYSLLCTADGGRCMGLVVTLY